MSSKDFLQDIRFLHQLDKLKIKTQYVKLTILNWKEYPLQQIQGEATNGSINLDGSSSMRRTATLTVVAKEKDNNLANIDSLFAINKKCKIELGIVNTVPSYYFTKVSQTGKISNATINYQQKYGQIVWFPLGLYIMFNPSITHGTDGVSISLQLKDKMCLLNGDLGGVIHSGVDFTYQEEVTNGDLLKVEQNPVLVYNIIKQLVGHWGNQNLSKIIISQVPLKIKRTVQWRGDKNIYLNHEEGGSYKLEFIEKSDSIQFKKYDDIGFVYEDFTFPGELTCNSGDTVTSVLDKIIGVLGNYEYFYDVEGNFIFRQKQNYLNMSNTAYWAKERGTSSNPDGPTPADIPYDVYTADTYRLSKSTYDLSNKDFVVNISNSLNFNNIKNDFVVWGAMKGVNDRTTLCRFHLAIDKKPPIGNAHTNLIFYEDNFQVVRGLRVADVTIYGETINIGGEQYTIKAKINGNKEEKEYRYSQDWQEELYYQMLESQFTGSDTNTELNNSYFQYYAELKQQFPKIYDLSSIKIEENGQLVDNNSYSNRWKPEVIQNPEQISYFLDFIDDDSELGQFSVSNIGRRSKIIGDNNDGINCVFEPIIPDIVYIDPTRYTNDEEVREDGKILSKMGQEWIQIPTQMYDYFETGGKLNSCFEYIKDLLYQFTHVNNSISITTVPIYYLQPNSRITVRDSQSGIDDDFIIQSISLPLDVSSTMSINAYKALQKI